mgnify:CR=1 FL=1
MLAGCLLYSSFYFYAGIAAAVFDLLVIAVFVIGVKNTYSEKIKYGGYLHEKKTNENDNIFLFIGFLFFIIGIIFFAAGKRDFDFR